MRVFFGATCGQVDTLHRFVLTRNAECFITESRKNPLSSQNASFPETRLLDPTKGETSYGTAINPRKAGTKFDVNNLNNLKKGFS